MSATLSSSEQSMLEEVANLKKLLDASGGALVSAIGAFKDALDQALGTLKLTPDQQKVAEAKKAADDAKKKVEDQWQSLGDSIAGALVKGISNLDDAEKALKGAFGDFFKNIQNGVMDQLKALISPTISNFTSTIGSTLSGLFGNPQGQSQPAATAVNGALSPVISPILGDLNPNLSRVDITASTGSSTAAGSNTAGAVTSLAGAAGPWGMAAVAAYAALSQFGKLQDAKTIEMTAEYRQKKQSTGEVLGDEKAKSDSLNKTLTILGANSKDLLSVNHDMYQALLDIKVGISGASAGLSRVIGKKGDFGLGVKTGVSTLPGSAGSNYEGQIFTSAFGIFGETGKQLSAFINGLGQKISSAIYNTKTKVIDSGVQFNGQSLASLLSGGDLNAQTYAEIETKKKLIGITVSNKAKTKNGDLDSLIKEQFADVFSGAGNAIKEASKAFGVNFTELSNKLKIDPSKLSLKGLTGDALTKEIESFFSATLDKWAGVLTSGTEVLKEFQKVGEGAFETVIRLASQVNTFSDYAQKLNLNFSLTGVDAIKASQAIGEYSGGFDVLTNNLSSYYKNYFTVEEQNLDITKKMKAEFESLGLVMPKTRDGFKDLVSAQNGATKAGQENIAMLLGVQDAFFKLTANVARVKATVEELNRLDAFGGVFSRISSMSDDARTSLIELAGGIESLLTKSQKFVDLYYSDDEKVGMQAKDVLGKLKAAGVSNSEDLKTTQDFRALMDKLTKADLETEAGRKFFNALLDIGPAFAAVADYLKKNNLTLGAAAQKGPTDDWFANYLAEQKKATEDTTAQLTSNQETTNAELAQINAALTDAKVDDPKTMIEKQELTNTYLASIDDGVRAGSSSVVAAINTAASSISEAVIRSMPMPAPAGRAVTSA